jgi:hypothetical protein
MDHKNKINDKLILIFQFIYNFLIISTVFLISLSSSQFPESILEKTFDLLFPLTTYTSNAPDFLTLFIAYVT